MTCANQELGVENRFIALDDVVNRHRVHVVNQDLVVDLMTVDPEVAPFVSCNHMQTNLSPLSRSVELLVDVSVEPKGLNAY